MPLPGRNTAFRYDVSDSLDTLYWYMERIREYVVQSIGNPLVLDTARKVVAHCQPYDQPCETGRVYDFILKKFRYTRSPALYGVETLQTPDKFLLDIAQTGRATGECDEMVVLLAAMLANLNHRVALVWGGDKLPTGEKNYRHVWVADHLPSKGGWVHLDPTGYLPPGQHFRFEVIDFDMIPTETEGGF